MKNRILLISLAVMLALSVGVIGCGGEEVPEYSLTISSTEGGSVTTPGEGTGSFTYDEGEVVNLVAEPDEGYCFENWTGNVNSIADADEATTTITMNSDCVIIASFEEEAVTFLDPNLETVIREEINKPTGDIYGSDLEGITSLNATEKNITYLTGLEFCYNLVYLYLDYNQIGHISPLANLTNLAELSLSSNQISSISPLANLTKLTRLDLMYNQIGNISPLANLASLTYLNLEWNHVNNISSLAHLTNLTSLDLWHNQILDISPLANLTSLTELYLSYNQISDIGPLANLSNLTLLDLVHNLITDISPLVDNEGLSEGDEIYLWMNPYHLPLSWDSINIYIPELEARGVTVYY